MVLLALLPVVVGTVFNAVGAALEGDDVVRAALLGAAGGAAAAAVLVGVAALAALTGLVDLGLTSLSL